MSAAADRVVEALVRVAREAPSADNMQPLHYAWDGHRLALRYDRERVGDHTFAADAPATRLAVGCALELIGETAARWDLGPRLALDPALPGAGLEYGAFTFERFPSQPPGTGYRPRHTNRNAYRREAPPADLLSRVGALQEGRARIRVFTSREAVGDLARLVRLASELRFRIREVHEWLGHSLRFSRDEVARGDGLDVATLGLPPGGPLFLRFIRDWRRMRLLNAVGGYKLVSAIDAAPVAAAPALVAVIAPRQPADALDAGRLLHRGWRTLNAATLGVHPYYVIADQLERLLAGRMPGDLQDPARALEEEARATLDLAPGETLHMLLRTGYPKRDARPSRRLPLERVYTHAAGGA